MARDSIRYLRCWSAAARVQRRERQRARRSDRASWLVERCAFDRWRSLAHLTFTEWQAAACRIRRRWLARRCRWLEGAGAGMLASTTRSIGGKLPKSKSKWHPWEEPLHEEPPLRVLP